MSSEILAEFDEAIERAPDLAHKACRQLHQGLVENKVLYAAQPVRTSLRPHFAPEATVHRWADSAARLIALLNRVGPLFLRERELYNRLGLPPETRSLIEVPPGYPQMAVLCRPDGVYQGDTMRFLEINADCPASVGLSEKLHELALSLYPLTELATRWDFDPPSRVRGLLTAMLDAYRAGGGKKTHPRLAVVAWNQDRNHHDRLLIVEEFTRLGFPAALLDPRELSYSGGRLYGRGEAIDLVNRRLQLHMLLERPDDGAALLNAYRDGAVCMVTPLSAEIVTSKALLAQLHSPDFQSYLSAEEHALVKELIPYTCLVEAKTRAELLADRPRWVVKPSNGYGGTGIAFGREHDDHGWRERVDQLISSKETWVAQQMAPTSTYGVLDAQGDRLARRELNVTWGPWIQGGRFNGITVRGSSSLCVNIVGGGAYITGLCYRKAGSAANPRDPAVASGAG